MFAPERKQFLRFSTPIAFVMRKVFSQRERRDIGVNCWMNWLRCGLCQKLHCVMQQMKSPTLILSEEVKIIWVMSRRAQFIAENWFIIHFSLQSLHPSLRSLQEVCFTLFNLVDEMSRPKTKRGAWKESRMEEDNVNVIAGWRETWFNIQTAVCVRKSLINHGNGSQVQGGSECDL